MMEDKERGRVRSLAVFGGTFNPIHNGHVHLARRFAEILNAERVLLIPTFRPPHKRADDLAGISDRLAMCRLASKGLPFEVSDLEIRRGGRSYTSDTLRELHGLYPNASLFLLMGEDMFLTLERWHDPAVIYSLATVCVAPRSGRNADRLSNGSRLQGGGRLQEYAAALRRKGVRVRVEPISYLPVSSTVVREAVRNGKSISGMVPEAVADYISEHHLYRE